MWIEKQADQEKEYGWWPVGIVRLHDHFMETHQLPKGILFLTCIYQALDNEVVAWAMNTANEITVDVLRDYSCETRWDIVSV